MEEIPKYKLLSLKKNKKKMSQSNKKWLYYKYARSTKFKSNFVYFLPGNLLVRHFDYSGKINI